MDRSMMHVQSSCFANINLLLFCSSHCRRHHCWLSIQLLWSRNFATMVTYDVTILLLIILEKKSRATFLVALGKIPGPQPLMTILTVDKLSKLFYQCHGMSAGDIFSWEFNWVYAAPSLAHFCIHWRCRVEKHWLQVHTWKEQYFQTFSSWYSK